MIPVFLGRVEAGHLRLNRPHDFWSHVRGFHGPVEVIVRRPRVMRSHHQNAYYWGVLIPLLAEQFGYLPDAMHEALKHQFLRVNSPDAPLPLIRSTATLTVQEFEHYLDTIRIWAITEHGITLPLPNEVEVA